MSIHHLFAYINIGLIYIPFKKINVYIFLISVNQRYCARVFIYIICITSQKNQQNNLLYSVLENILNYFITIDIA